MSSDQLFSRAIRMAKPDAYPVHGAPPEARTRPSLARRRLEALVFVNLGPTNEGLPTSARKEGPAFQAMKRLTIDQKLSVIFKLAGIDGWLRSTAKVVWLSHSGTAGGLQLVDMSIESRRVVDMWFSAREQAGHAVAASGSQTASPNAVAQPASTDFGLDSYQVVLPVEAIEIAPGPAQRSQPLAHVAVQANARAAAPRIETSLGTGVAVPQVRGSAGEPEAARASVPRKSFKIERKTAKSFALVLWALLGMFFLAGIIIAEFHGSLPARLADAEPVPLAVPPAPSAVSLPPADARPDSSVAPPSKPAIAPEPALGAPETAVLDARKSTKVAKPASLVAPGAPARATGQPQGSRPAASQLIARAAEPSAAVRPASSARPASPILTAASPAPAAAAAATAPANPVSERPPVTAAPAVLAEKASLPAAAPPVNPETPTGSVEIIADPYPSIRAPAGPTARASRPAALSIGTLISKVEPVYPPEALRQRVAGKVKLHIVRGVDGQVETATVTDGPIQLRNAALQAVQQWRYEPTLLGSTPVEAEEDVTLIFRIAAPFHPGN
jgi:TonB family protein